jgi:ribosomal protein L32
MATTRLKMEDAYSLCNVIEIFCRKKITKTKRGRRFGPFKLQMALAQLCKNTSTCLYKLTNTSTAKGEEFISGVSVMIAPFFGLNCIKSSKYLGDARSKK